MLKQITILSTTLFLTGLLATAALGATAKCTVTAIDEASVTLDCGKKAGKLHVGDTVKVKAMKKQAIEGC